MTSGRKPWYRREYPRLVAPTFGLILAVWFVIAGAFLIRQFDTRIVYCLDFNSAAEVASAYAGETKDPPEAVLSTYERFGRCHKKKVSYAFADNKTFTFGGDKAYISAVEIKPEGSAAPFKALLVSTNRPPQRSSSEQ